MAGLTAAIPAQADWSAPIDVPIASPSVLVPLSLEVAVAPDGAIVAVWGEDDGLGNVSLETTRIAPDGTVGAVRPLADADVNPPRHVAVRVGPNGTATVVWERENEEGEGVVQTIRIAPDGTPAAEVEDLSNEGADAVAPHFALDQSGAATVVWQQTDGGGDPAIESLRIAADGTIGETQEISNDGEGEGAFTPRVALAPDGVATAFWISADGPESVGLQAVEVAANGTVGSIVDAVEDVSGTIYPPALAVGADGAATAVWQQTDGDEATVRTVRIAPNGVAGSAHDIGAPHYVAAASLGEHPAVVVGPNGVATAVWVASELDSPWVVQTARIATNGIPGAAHDLSPLSVRSTSSADAVIDSAGVATAIWHSAHPSGDNSAIEAVRIAANGTAGAVDTLAFSESSEGIPDLSSPAIGSSTQGGVSAGWQSATAVNLARFTDDGSGPVGEPEPPLPGPGNPAPPTTKPPAAPRAALALLVRPKRLTVKRGKRARLAITVRNAGGATAKRVRICVRAPKHSFRAVKCLQLGQLAKDKRVRRSIVVRLQRAPRTGVAHSLRLTVSSTGIRSKSATVRIKIRR